MADKAKTEAKKDSKALEKNAAKEVKDKNKKPNIFKRIGRWFKDLRLEVKKIQWPTAKETAKNTLIVIAVCLLVGVCIWLFDALASGLVSAIINLVQG